MKLIVALAAAFPLFFANAEFALAADPDGTVPTAKKIPAQEAPAAPKAPGTFATAPT